MKAGVERRMLCFLQDSIVSFDTSYVTTKASKPY